MRRLAEIVVLAAASLCGGCWGMAYKVPTDAMRPTITREDMCVVNPAAYSYGEIKRFDIVVFEMPESEKRRVNAGSSVRHIKRVVGLPGEKIEIRENKLFVNDLVTDEPFEKILSSSDPKKNFGPTVVPNDEYFILGDNRPESSDSRYFEHPTIKKADIYSKVIEIKKGYYANR
ncbi:MAG TPA: signal peptidase I [Pyrinomonadaceae bacterium]|nr:signal peptidase I [Pyrinomonadaceae bacterium]